MENNSSVTLLGIPDLNLEEISQICEGLKIQLTSPCWDKEDDLVFLFFDWGKVWLAYWTSSAVPRSQGFTLREQIQRTDLNTGLKFYKSIPLWVLQSLDRTVKARLLYIQQEQEEAWKQIQVLLGDLAKEVRGGVTKEPH